MMNAVMHMLPALTVLIAGSLAAQTTMSPREKEFQDSLAGVVLEGQSTRDSRPGVSDDKYTIDKIVKTGEDKWTIYARVAYKGQNTTMPIPIEVKWAGDTPVITLTDQSMPGLGTYTARVLIYQGRYAGTWSGKSGGGTVFGRIVKQ